MTFDDFDSKPYKPTKEEQKLLMYVENKRSEMNTPYRQRGVALAAWAQKTYQGQSNERVTNRDIISIPMSYSIVNQRLSALYSNPSKAEYKVVDENKEVDVEVLRQVDKYDKQISNFNSDYQEIEQIANIEGTCFFRENWLEQLGQDGETIGVPSTKLSRVRMNDFYWDAAARRPNEMMHGLERSIISFEDYLRRYLPKDGLKGFKNIRSVLPVSGDADNEGSVWNEDWEEYGRDVEGNNVVLWFFESKGIVTKDGVKPKACIIANGVVIYESDELFTPKNSPTDPDVLMWSKIDGIPTGHMIGMGIPVLIRHPQGAFDRLLTLSIAQAELAVSPPLFVRPGAGPDMDDYDLFPGLTIPINGSSRSIGEDYQWLQVPDITSGSQKMMNDLIEYMTVLTGVDVKALFVPASEKAITTENKRQIQEKLLRFSVLWNEENGFKDLQYRRLRLIQHYYPKKRFFAEDDNGTIKIVERNLRIPVPDFEVDEGIGGDGKIKLNFKKGAYNKIDITDEALKFDVDLVIEGAGMAQEEDIIKQRNFIEHLQIILSIPQFAEKLSAEKTLKMLLKRMKIMEEDVLDDPSISTLNMHPANKEIAAIKMVDVLEEQGVKFPDVFDEFKPDSYVPEEYLRVFAQYQISDGFKGMSPRSIELFEQRFKIHSANAANPYFFEMEQKKTEQEPSGQLEAGKIPAPQAQEEGSLTQSVRKQAGELAAQSR